MINGDPSGLEYIKELGDEKLECVPIDLDTKPYRDEHDQELLKRMQQALQETKTRSQ